MIHVKDYGAVGDGTTDDAAAIQAAIDAAAAKGCGVELESGREYRVSAAVVLPLGVPFNGNGSVLMQASPNGGQE